MTLQSSTSSTGTAPVLQPFLPIFTQLYYHEAAKAYNMTRYVVSSLKLDDTVFASAMCYWHEFATAHGCRRIPSVVLAAACIFLAGKVEHYKLRVDQIVSIVFEVNVTRRDEDVAGWRRMVLEAELVLSDALHFDFQRTHATSEMLKMLSAPCDAAVARQTEVQRRLVAQMQSIAMRFYVLSLITPLYTKIPVDRVLRTIVYMTVHYAGQEALYSQMMHDELAFSSPDAAEREGIMGVIIDAFAFMRKTTGLDSLDEVINRRRKQVRRPSTADGVAG